VEENVLVVKTQALSDILTEEGVLKVSEEIIESKLREFGEFLPRNAAEFDENYRQIIPYVVMMSEGKVLLLRRTTRQGEKRLHNKYSLGVGGHINDTDASSDLWETFKKGMEREINEEVEVEIKELKYIGLINETSTEVSRVHLGIAYVAEVEFFGLREEDMFEIQWIHPDELCKKDWGLEGWSKLVLKEITGC